MAYVTESQQLLLLIHIWGLQFARLSSPIWDAMWDKKAKVRYSPSCPRRRCGSQARLDLKLKPAASCQGKLAKTRCEQQELVSSFSSSDAIKNYIVPSATVFCLEFIHNTHILSQSSALLLPLLPSSVSLSLPSHLCCSQLHHLLKPPSAICAPSYPFKFLSYCIVGMSC